MDRRLFFTLLVYSFTLFILYQVYTLVSPFLAPLVLAGVLCVTTYPLYERLLRRVSNRHNLAASLMTAAVILTCVAPLVILSVLVSHEAVQATRYLEALTATGTPDLFGRIRNSSMVAPWLSRLGPLVEQFPFDLHGALVSAAKGLMSLIVGYSGQFAKNVVAFLLKTVIMVIALFFIYRDGESFQRQVWSIIPFNRHRRQHMVETVERVLAAVFYGVFLTCLVQGALGGVGFWIAGVPAPGLFGAAMALAALIPVVGTALVWVPGALYLFLQGKVWQGVFLVIWGSLAVSSIDNLIRPLFISGKAHMSVLVIALGMLGGLVSFGFSGIITGPVILALFIALFQVYRVDVYPGSQGGGEDSVE